MPGRDRIFFIPKFCTFPIASGRYQIDKDLMEDFTACRDLKTKYEKCQEELGQVKLFQNEIDMLQRQFSVQKTMKWNEFRSRR